MPSKRPRVLLRTMVLLVALGACAAARAVPPPARVPADGWNLDINRALDAIGIAPGMTVGEAGAGHGYFTLPMARRIGPSGGVYANDIDEAALSSLSEKARRERLANVHTVTGTVDDPLFPRSDLELVVVVHAFHDFGRPVEWLVNLKKYLRPGGELAIIDLDPSQGAPSHFLPRGRILAHAASAGYEVAKSVDDIPEYLVILLKPRATGGAR